MNFLFASFGTYGTLMPLLTGARQLRVRGHHVRVLVEPAMRAEVEAAGFESVAWRRAPSDPDREVPFSTFDEWLGRMIFYPAAAYAADAREEISRAPTDAVLCLDLAFGCALAARASGVPYAIFSPHVSIRPLPGMPVVGSGRPSPKTPEERQATEAAAAWLASKMDSFLPDLDGVCHELGLTPLASSWDVMDRADRVLLAIGRSFDFQAHPLPNNFRYVGPLLDEPGWAKAWTRPWRSATRPGVLLACSTGAQGQQPVFEKTIRAIGMLDVEAIATTGPAIELQGILAPPNVHVVKAAPHDAVMREVSVVVTHGGHGTVSRALLHGLPMLIIPKGRDQHDNAARVEAHGAGLRLSCAASEAEIAHALHRLVSEPCFQACARHLGLSLKGEIDARVFVSEMEEIALGGRQHCPRRSS